MSPMFHRGACLRACLLACVLVPGVAVGQELPLHGQAFIHFASSEEGMELLSAPDPFLDSLSPFDRQARVEADGEVDQPAFLAFLRSHVRPWDVAEMGHLRQVVESLRPKLAAFQLPFPRSVWLVKTTGREEGDAAYCRQHAIVLPQSKTRSAPRELERLLTHELFHILSRRDLEFRRGCYQVIGFRMVEPVSLPESLRDRRITNPDGPRMDAVIDVQVDGHARTVVPVLYSSQPKFDPRRGGPFFKYLTFHLLVVEPAGEGWRGAERNGEPWLLIPDQVPDFSRQIGANTSYIIHPDEVLADNFVHAVQGTRDLRSPHIVGNLVKVLKASVPARPGGW